MTNKADERLDEIINHFKRIHAIKENEWIYKESIRILKALKNENRDKWITFGSVENFNMDKMILNEGE